MEYPKPNVFVSKCLGLAHCRWNAETIPSKEVETLLPFINLFTACPESDMGLGSPRKTLRIVRIEGKDRLFQPATGKDMTDKMTVFTEDYLKTLSDMDGFVLKYGSPSCGPKNVRIYSQEGNYIHGIRPGFFGERVKAMFPISALEDEGRLSNYIIRENFLTQIFTFARFRASKDLQKFHEEHRLLLLSYGENMLDRELGNPTSYREKLFSHIQKIPTKESIVNVLCTNLQELKDGLSKPEQEHYVSMLEDYLEDRIPASALMSVVVSWLMRFNRESLLNQYFFQPYPKGLILVRDSGKACAR